MGLIASLWVYYDYRDRRLFEDERRRVIFHCIRCDKLYAGRAGAEELNCPRCGLRNGRLRF
ncbi:MAG: hydrogenase nickel incorporation protein HypA [Puniceicoccaceae bacterium]|nr:MAG: hydrogenase nickel incorporation protein HypA [Puniceicoccaceae bacterium]